MVTVRMKKTSAGSWRFFRVCTGLVSRRRHTLRCVCVCPGLVQRCVIIQRDKNGFGLTVSGDNPVFVQLVKESKWNSGTRLTFPSRWRHSTPVVCVVDGAAMRAGVQTGDRIIKVRFLCFQRLPCALLLLCFLQLLPVVFRLTGLWWRAQTTWRLSSW